MKQLKGKTNVLIEALPYIKNYHGKVVVIKYGGNAMRKHLKKSVMTDIILLKHVGMKPVIVHGGGKEINKEMEKKKIKPRFVNGLRVTDKATVKIIEDVFNNINNDIYKLIKKCGGKPISLSGKDHSIIHVKQKNPKLGFVGKIRKMDIEILMSLINQNYIPIISPIGADKENNTYNINADSAASALASALQAEKLTILTDVTGVYENKKLISQLSIRGAKKKIRRKIITKGMIPKVEACIDAVKQGCPKAHLIDGTIKHGLLLEIFTDEGVGTEIVKKKI